MKKVSFLFLFIELICSASISLAMEEVTPPPHRPIILYHWRGGLWNVDVTPAGMIFYARTVLETAKEKIKTAQIAIKGCTKGSSEHKELSQIIRHAKIEKRDAESMLGMADDIVDIHGYSALFTLP